MIYPVPIKEWFCEPDSAFHKYLKDLRTMLPEMKCFECGKPVTEETGWTNHSACHEGYHEDMTFCSEECRKK